ncbi:MAG: lipid II:glycine glycyltransferase FemX [bacterium]
MYRTEIATDEELKTWDQIILRCQYSEALHSSQWCNALSLSFKQMTPLYLLIKDNKHNIIGAMPCFLFNPIPFIKTLLSMPWTLPGGPLFFSSDDIFSAVLSVNKKLDEISKKYHSYKTVITLPVNSHNDIHKGLISSGYIIENKNFTHILDVREGYENVWNSYNKRVRGAIRKAIKSGVIVSEAKNEEDMEDFYKLYLSMMDKFNSTPKPYSLFKLLQTSSIAKLIAAYFEDKLIAGLLFIHFNKTVRLWVEASDHNYLNYRPNNAIIDYIVRWACNNEYSFVDFGASPPDNNGLVAFKEEWRAEKVWFYTYARLYSAWKNTLWHKLEPPIRRIYATIQRLAIQ